MTEQDRVEDDGALATAHRRDHLGPPAPPGRARPTVSGAPSMVRGRSSDRAELGRNGGELKRRTHRWARWLHVYTSMIALLIVLFFGITGITLNHPTWTFGDDVDVTTVTGSLPFTPTRPDGSVDYLSISEYARDEHGVTGHVDSFETVGGEGSIAYKKPGYSANLRFAVDSGTFELTVEQQGWLAVMNDLHKGRDSGPSWRWLIDVAGGFLVVIAATGLVMQLFLRKRRRRALVSALVGVAVVLAVGWLSLH